MKNKFPAYCVKCEHWVGKGYGNTRKEAGEWVTEHIQCPDLEKIEAEKRERRKLQAYEAEIANAVRADEKCQAWASSRGIRL